MKTIDELRVWVRQVRLAKRISQGRVADVLGMDRSAYCKFERGHAGHKMSWERGWMLVDFLLEAKPSAPLRLDIEPPGRHNGGTGRRA